MSIPTHKFLVERAPVTDRPIQFLPLPTVISVLLPMVPNTDFHCRECQTVYPVLYNSAIKLRSPLGMETQKDSKRRPRVYVCDHYGKLI